MSQLIYQEALDAVEELAGLFAQSGGLQARIVKMLDHGSGLFDVEVDEAATVAAGERVIVYKPSDTLLGLLATLQTFHGDSDGLPGAILECVCHRTNISHDAGTSST